MRYLEKIFLLFLTIIVFNAQLYAIDVSDSTNEDFKIALVLSGGGARGFAHIPIIEAIERHNIPIDIVVGTSMGSLIGGLYAAGYSPKDMRELLDEYDMVDLFTSSPAPFQKPVVSSFPDYRDNILNLLFDKRGVGRSSGLLGDQKILEMLNASLINTSAITNFNHLPIPYRCVGTNLVTGEEIVFSSGSLIQSIRASISIPGVFTPAIVGDKLVVDGGLVNNLPIDIAKEMGADIIIAVDVNAVDYTVTKDELNSLTSILGQLVIILTKNTVVDQIKDATLLFSPLVEDFGILDFPSYERIIKIGEECALEMEDQLTQLSQEISLFRECPPIDLNRTGSYFSLPSMKIDTVIHSPIIEDNLDIREFPIKKFYEFQSSFLHKEEINELNFLLNEERELDQYATVTYQVSNIRFSRDGQPHGDLEIHTREFEDRNNTLGIGVFGSTNLSYTNAIFGFTFNPNFSLTFQARDFIFPNFEFTFRAVEKEYVKVESTLAYTFLSTYRLGIRGEYQRGALHAYNASSLSSTEYGADNYAAPTLFFEYLASPYSTVGFSVNSRSIWYENSDLTFTHFITPSITLFGVHAYQKTTLFPAHGLRVDSQGTLFLGTRLGYTANVRVKQAITLSHMDSLLLDLKLGSTHSIDAHVDDYYHYGGFDGIITQGANILVKDYIIGGISYLHWFKKSPVPIVFKTGVTAGLKGKEAKDIYQLDLYTVETSPTIWFSPDVDIVGMIGLGFSFRNADMLIGLALDNSLSTSLFIEVR